MSYEQGFIEKCAQFGVDPQSLVKEAMLYQYDQNPFDLWRQRTGYRPQGLFGSLLGLRPLEFYRSPEYFNMSRNLPKNWQHMRGAVAQARPKGM